MRVFTVLDGKVELSVTTLTAGKSSHVTFHAVLNLYTKSRQ